MGDVALYRRLVRQAWPYWPQFLGLFAIGMLATPIALLNPVPLKIVVDSVIGASPLPAFLRALLPEAATRSPGAILFVAIGLLLIVAVLRPFQALGSTLLRTYVGERLVLHFPAPLLPHVQPVALSYHDSRGPARS